MSEPFLGEIRLFGFNFAPRGWAFCDGQLLPINQFQALFSLLGTVYGGDGRTTFALPDLRGRVSIHVDSAHPQGQRAGTERHALTTTEMPGHAHMIRSSNTQGSSKSPAGRYPANESNGAIAVYGTSPNSSLNAGAVTSTGAGQAHENMQPFLVLSFAIALQGIFPSRS